MADLFELEFSEGVRRLMTDREESILFTIL
jgi:hypothetical protein